MMRLKAARGLGHKKRQQLRDAARASLSVLLVLALATGGTPTLALAEVEQNLSQLQAAETVAAAPGEATPSEAATEPEAATTDAAAPEATPAGDEVAAETSESVAEQPAATSDDVAATSAAATDAPATEGTPEATATEAATTDPVAAEYAKTEDDLARAQVEGEAAASEDAAESALLSLTDLDAAGADEVATMLFSAPLMKSALVKANANASEPLPQDLDGSQVKSITARWVTPDTTGNDNDGELSKDNAKSGPNTLSLVPADNASQRATLRINYALSGEHDYNAGDITITLPASIFNKRDGADADSIQLSVPEDPSTKGSWNYKIVSGEDGDQVVITNTRAFSAASQGFIELAYNDVRPSEVADTSYSDEFQASIEVVTHLGNTIGATSNPLVATIDTTAEVTRAYKSEIQYNPTRLVTVSQMQNLTAGGIPEQFKNETKGFVVVSWRVYPTVDQNSNQPYTLVFEDRVADDYRGFVVDSGISDTHTVNNSQDSRNLVDATKLTETYVASTYNTNKADALTNRSNIIQVAYPLSQFTTGQTYTFKNDVKYTLTPADKIDDATTANASDTLSWTYEEPVEYPPGTILRLDKYGNSDTAYGIGKETISPYGLTSIDVTFNSTDYLYRGYWGKYPSGLNTLSADHGEAQDQTISYSLETIAQVLPYTLEPGTDPMVLSNYGKVPATVTTTDTGMSWTGRNLTEGTDYDFASYEFSAKPAIRRATAINIDADGKLITLGNGRIDYEYYTNDADVPVISLQAQLEGSDEWVTVATADWTSGALNLQLASTAPEGSAVSASKVTLPKNVTNVRTTYTSATGGVVQYGRVGVTLHAGSAVVKSIVNDAFAASDNPVSVVSNSAQATVTPSGWSSPAVTDGWTGNDRLYGYSEQTRASLYKNGEVLEHSKEGKPARVKYTATLNVKSYIGDKELYEEAQAAGELEAHQGGTWYDLLPEGMIPDLSTIKLNTQNGVRSADAVKNAYTIENHNNTGRTLLVVEVDLTPVAQAYKDGGNTYYMDAPYLEFEADEPYSVLEDYGQVNEKGDYHYNTHNVVAFESDEDTLGTMDGERGETDDARGTNNASTKAVFEHFSDDIKNAMTDLDKDSAHDGWANFVYADARLDVSALRAAHTELTKDVMVNNDGWWSDGLYYEHADTNARNVYEGGNYSYRISTGSGEDTKSSNLVFFDKLESFAAGAGNDKVDIDAPTWKGKPVNVDVNALRDRGVDAKVYYSTHTDIAFESASIDDKVVENTQCTDLANTDYWTLWTAGTAPEDLSKVTAIAVDASKKMDGADFVLNAGETASFIVNMHAPQGKAAAKYIAEKAHAYNNVYQRSSSTQDDGGHVHKDFIRKDYTKVGLSEYKISATKAWNDDNNRDRVRPESVTLKLMRTDKTEAVATAVVSVANNWTATFEHLPYATDAGDKIVYCISEEPVEGYTLGVGFADGNGQSFKATNTHVPERVSVEGAKTWEGDTAANRPSSITIDLYRQVGGGARTWVASKTVSADADGNWGYGFTDLYKYENGKPITYTVEERLNGLASYISTQDGTNFTNVYHPYGDLQFSKTVKAATDLVKGAEFPFLLVLTKDGQPVDGDYDYVVTDAAGKELRTGTVATGDTITLHDGETATVKELPEGVSYELQEQTRGGFAITSSVGAVGTIQPNDTVKAQIENTYATEGKAYLQATKLLNGRSVLNQAFAFNLELQDVKASDGTSLGKGVATEAQQSKRATSSRGTTVRTEDDGNIVSQAEARFGALYFSNVDNGRTFVYKLTEENKGRVGYTYDGTVYTVEVTPTDNGDGTMTVAVVYKDAQGNVLPNGAADVKFNNTYRATGEYTPTVYKQLSGGKLAADQFEFELYRVNVTGTGDATNSELVQSSRQTARNDAAGMVSFATLNYDQRDAGKTYYYVVHEIADAADESVQYDGHWYPFSVTVTDVNSGKLSISTVLEGVEIPCWNCGGTGKVDDKDCTVCGGSGKLTAGEDSLVFKNAMSDGGLSITKNVDGAGDPNNPDQIFEFTVRLNNENGESLDLSDDQFVLTKVTKSLSSLASIAGNALGTVAKTLAPEVAYADEGDIQPETEYTNNGHTCYWRIDKDGILTIRGEISLSSSNSPWYSYRDKITSVKVLEGTKGYGSLNKLFYNLNKATTIDVSKLDTSNVANMGQMFDNCSALISLNLSSFNTSKVTFMSSMFNNCSHLTTLDLSSFDMSNVTMMNAMFKECNALATLTLGDTFGAPKATTLNELFYGCKALSSLDASKLNTSGATSMASMFNGCSSLTGLDLSSFDTSKVTDMNYMFYDCSSAKSINVSSFNTSNVEKMSGMFNGCSGLASLDVTGFKTPKATNMSSMFSGCSGLASLDVTKFDTSIVTNMSSMFSGCSGLASLDVTNFKTPKATNMSSMFSGCERLISMDLSSFTIGAKANVKNMLPASIAKLTVGAGFRSQQGPGEDGIGLDRSATWVDEADESKDTMSTTQMLAKARTINEDHTYVQELPVRIAFDGNGGSGSMPPQAINALVSNTLNANIFLRPRYAFLGWNTMADGSGTHYDDGATLSAKTFTTDTTLYAQWRNLVTKNSDGTYTVRVAAGEKLTINDLPAGTTYSIDEGPVSGWSLVSADGVNGTVESRKESAATFTNKYDKQETSAVIEATKTFDGLDATAADGFEFELRNSADAVVQTKTADGGAVVFSPVAFNAAGKYTYTIREKAGSNALINYDSAVVTATVTVKDEGGALTSSVAYASSDSTRADKPAAFVNTSKTGSLQVSKAVDGAGSSKADQQFSFRVTIGGRVYTGDYAVASKDGTTTASTRDGVITLTAGQTATFDGITAGTAYAVEEIDLPAGWSLDESTGTTGTIAADTAAVAAFTNSYEASGSVVLSAAKSFEHGVLSDGQFEFELIDLTTGSPSYGERVGAKATNGEPSATDGVAEVVFDPIEYTKAGTYVYGIREVVPAQKAAGVVYDTTQRTVTVTVIDNGNGTLTATADQTGRGTNDSLVFANTLETHTLSITKALDAAVDANKDKLSKDAGEGLNQEFELVVGLKDAAGASLADVAYTVDGAAAGTVSDGGTITLKAGQTAELADLPYGTAWTVGEDSLPAGWSLAKADADSGKLVADDASTVTNTYAAEGSIELKVGKTLDGGVPDEGEFSFELYDADPSTEGATLLERVQNDAEGKVTFTSRRYTLADVGEHTYWISEVSGSDPDVKYDDRTFEVKVTVADNGDGTLSVTQSGLDDTSIFENKTLVHLATTGAAGVGAAGVVAVVAGVAGAWLRRRKRS